jgi:6-phosphogluconolactonase
MVLAVKVFSDLSTLSEYAALYFATLAKKAVAQRGRFVVALNGGSTPQTLFHRLASAPYARDSWWQATHLFFGDERCVPPEDEESNYGQVKRNLLDLLETQPEVSRMRGELAPVEAQQDYRQQLYTAADAPLAWPRFDLVLLGMGTDGHTASLFPGSEPDPVEAVLAVKAEYQNRPAWRISLTPRVFNSARAVLFMTGGANKAGTLAAVLNVKADPLKLPARRIDLQDGDITWLVDEAAASLLPESLIKREKRR